METCVSILNQFVGGNIRVVKTEGQDVYLENELRDTEGTWFYWAFCVEGAQGQTLTFHMEPTRLGYWGPAVSHDLRNWKWLDDCNGDSFTYRFAAGEKRVYFAHHMLYHPDRFFDFCQERELEILTLCKSRKGRSVPCLCLGEGERSILLTARHHACESTGSYVLEGVLEELLSAPIPNTRLLVVPFVDYDGVVEGDQGKSRIPHDHNRDYIDEPIYPEVASVLQYVSKHGCHYAFDFHSPWHKKGVNDTIFVVRNSEEKLDRFDRFSDALAAEITEGSMAYEKKNDYPPHSGWNQPSPNCAFTMNKRSECELAFSLENAYFGTPDNKVSQSRLIELGRCFARAMKRFIMEGRV